MTAADDVANIIVGSGATAVTIYTTEVEKVFVKPLVVITPGQSTGNKGDGPLDTMIADLQRVEIRFTIMGYIASADETKLENLFTGGGVFNLTYDGTDYDVNMDKLSIKKSAKEGEQDERLVMFTAVVGVDIG